VVTTLKVVHCFQVGVGSTLWVVGAQNAGKSSLLNAFKRVAGSLESTAELTTAALPGTTLGTTPVLGLPLLRKSKCFDTPGIPHTHQYTSQLSGVLKPKGSMSVVCFAWNDRLPRELVISVQCKC
jgi:ribosome biogenesis GTPase A